MAATLSLKAVVVLPHGQGLASGRTSSKKASPPFLVLPLHSSALGSKGDLVRLPKASPVWAWGCSQQYAAVALLNPKLVTPLQSVMVPPTCKPLGGADWCGGV